ncbi:transmembrane protein [Thalictrum thalictroides]|uniref:Transmembrane protein n=1 Tax=Thalictrum thalictroides TaxID=46969 RepID=A0A7J6XES1_THATH|nr:transmembrane protein [Thalictrum thalictroides]
MAVSLSSVSLSLLPSPTSTFSLQKSRFYLNYQNSSCRITSFSILPTTLTSFPPEKTCQKSKIWKISVAPEDVLPSEASLETTQDIVPAASDGVSNIVSGLLFIAFIGLSVLTVGVIYIAVTDFLQKREKEKFEKEEAENKSKMKGKKGTPRAKTGPRGFGQTIEEDDDV